MEFREYLKQKREDAGLSIRQLALYSDVSAGYLSQIENGNRSKPSVDVIKKLHKPLKISYDDLMKAAGYLEDIEDLEKALDDPDFEIFYKELKGSPEENRKKALEFLRFINEQEKN